MIHLVFAIFFLIMAFVFGAGGDNTWAGFNLIMFAVNLIVCICKVMGWW